MAVIKQQGKLKGYMLSNGEVLTKEAVLKLAKAGIIANTGVVVRNGNEYLINSIDTNLPFF